MKVRISLFTTVLVLFLLPSCGNGGATLNTGDINAVWMPNGTTVNANIGAVEIEHDTRGRSMEEAPAPQSVSWVVESRDKLALALDGNVYSCSYNYRQQDSTFVLDIQADNGKVLLQFANGRFDAVEASNAVADMTLQYGGSQSATYGKQQVELSKTTG